MKSYKTKYIYLLLLFFLLNSCVKWRYVPYIVDCVCNYTGIHIDTIPQDPYYYMWIDTITNIVMCDTINVDPIIKRFNIISEYYDRIRWALNKDSIPDFFYDPCVDYKLLVPEDYESGCWINSFRGFVIHNLSDHNLEKILRIGNVKKLKLKCRKNMDIRITLRKKSTYDLIIEEQERRKKEEYVWLEKRMKRTFAEKRYLKKHPMSGKCP